MRPRLPSLTAASVAVLRSLSSLPGAPFDTANDAALRALAPLPIALALRGLGGLTARAPIVHEALRRTSFGLYDHVALRTRAIDTCLLRELQRPLPQLVICGAGLDARAFRLRELSETLVLEVDHPATQRLKRARARVTPHRAREVRFVGVDFERESLDTRLTEAGHDPRARTVWIWEGVTPYLPPAATEATLAVLAARSAPGSLALVTYARPEMVNVPAALRGPIHAGFSVLGEPLAGAMTTDAMHALAQKHGLGVESDTGSADWADAHLRGERSPVVIEERLVALRRR